MPARLEFNPAFYKKTGASFALWRLPHSPIKQCIVGKEKTIFEPQLIHSKLAGFAFVPFENLPDELPLLLRGKLFNDPDTITQTTKVDNYYLNKEEVLIESAATYIENVAQGVAEIKQGLMQKVVLARNEQWQLPNNFCPLNFFNKLCDKYPEAFVSLVSIKDVGTWIGATPEYLLKITPEKLMTVALAGTQLNGSAQWSEKEDEEQQWVVRYIEDVLSNYKGTKVEIDERKIIRNGPLEHLYNTIYFKNEQFKNTVLAANILHHLHPTPAVCGLPRQKAAGFIATHEKFFRNYYSGFLGPMNIEGASNFFVNLRCMQLTTEGAVAYAGAGITAGSVPEKEFAETENKFNNLKSFIN